MSLICLQVKKKHLFSRRMSIKTNVGSIFAYIYWTWLDYFKGNFEVGLLHNLNKKWGKIISVLWLPFNILWYLRFGLERRGQKCLYICFLNFHLLLSKCLQGWRGRPFFSPTTSPHLFFHLQYRIKMYCSF